MNNQRKLADGYKNAPIGEREEPQSYYQKLLAMSPGNYFLQSFAFPFMMTRDEAFILSHLLNYAERCMSLKRNNGWFYCTTERMEAEINVDRQAQHRIIKRLVANGYVRQKRMGMPPVRYFKIDADLVDQQARIALDKRREGLENLRRRVYRRIKRRIAKNAVDRLM